jgi:hypothetical protein
MDTQGSVYKGRDSKGLEHFVTELYADDESDIKNKTQFGNIVAEPDSTAFVAHSGKLYILDGSGVWYCKGEAIS